MKIIQRNIKKISFLIVLGVFLICGAKSVHAETHVSGNDLLHGGSWNKQGSPYILDEDVYIPDEYSLHITEGVTVISASTSDEYGFNPHSLTFDGNLSIWGSIDEPVNIIGLNSMYFNYSDVVDIKNTVFDNTGLDFNKSTSTISNVIIKNSDIAISARGSNITLSNSELLRNKIGIGSYELFAGPFLSYENNIKDFANIGVGGDGFDGETDMTFGQPQNILKINNSNIVGNSEYGILQESVNPIDAANNWWGSKSGPKLGSDVYGLVNYTPWLDKDINEKTTCCSNVLFIPGFEASRLYKDTQGILGTSTNMLWEPNRNDDIKKMYLDKDGKSLDQTIYTSDIIDAGFGLDSKSIYKSFIAMMNGVVADGSINEWLPFPYDWRMNVEEVVNDITKLSSTSISLITEVEKLAQNSKTGKVIIIAHSNGGLVTKELMKALELKGEGTIIEKIINIAVPELGTPQAILGMLHGNNQSLLGGLFLTENNARTFSQNMSGAYGLLPSKKFFEKNPITVISNLFSSSSISFASTYDAMKSFLLSNLFSKTSSTNVSTPLLLNSSLLSVADNIHSAIDIFKTASTTKTLSIFGWGVPTSEGVSYEIDPHCDQKKRNVRNIVCENIYAPVTTDAGDGTVITKANSNNADSTLFFDLKKIKNDTKEEIVHADILESPDLLAKVKDTINDGASTDKSYEKYFSTTEPIDTEKHLTIKIYSPVDIDVYDKEGNHTGLREASSTNPYLKKYEDNIPGSYYWSSPGGVKLVRIPYGEDYQILLKGNDTGTVIVKADITQFDKVISQISFGEIPVTKNLNAEMIIATNTDMLATSTTIIIDENGDGITEYEQNTEEYLDKHQKERGHRKDIRKKIINKFKKMIKSIRDH